MLVTIPAISLTAPEKTPFAQDSENAICVAAKGTTTIFFQPNVRTVCEVSAIVREGAATIDGTASTQHFFCEKTIWLSIACYFIIRFVGRFRRRNSGRSRSREKYLFKDNGIHHAKQFYNKRGK